MWGCLLAVCVLESGPPVDLSGGVPVGLAGDRPGVLVFSRTNGFRHGSIEAGHRLIQSLGEGRWRVEGAEGPDVFTPERLAGIDVVVLLHTTGDVITDAGEAAMEQFLLSGGGLVAVHGAADGERDWPFFGSRALGGAWFESHPQIQQASVIVEDRHHPATAAVGERWVCTDEWYNFVKSPRGSVHVLASLDEQSYEGGSMGVDHPIVWSTPVGDGAAFYTGLGHTVERYSEPAFQAHLQGAIEWALADGWIELDKGWQARAGWQDVAAVTADGPALQLAAGSGVLVNGADGHAGDLVTGGVFGDCELHVEFLIPEGSNSGVYLQGRYEVQILDSHGKSSPGPGDCGGIYERWDESRSPKGFEGVPPRTNAAAAPGVWQSFDIVFRAPAFDAAGEKIHNARFESVRHNGVLIHEDVELGGPTRGGRGPEAAEGPVRFQGDHGPVAYRNVRIKRGAGSARDDQSN